jgi:hypothetical protein
VQVADVEISPEEGHVYWVEEPKPVNQWMRVVLLAALGAPFVFWVLSLALIPPRQGTYEDRLWAYLWAFLCLLVLVAPFVVIYGWLYQSFRRQTYLRVTPEELEYYTPGLRIRTPWASIDKIDNGKALLREPDLRDMKVWAWFFSFSASHRSKYDPAITQMIPISPFGWTKSSPVVRDIQQHTPHLDQRWLNQVPYREFLEK